MCMEIGNLSGVATNLDKRRGNTVAGQRLLVKARAKRGDSLTVTGCQGRCSLRHLYLKADGAIHVEFYLNRKKFIEKLIQERDPFLHENVFFS